LDIALPEAVIIDEQWLTQLVEDVLKTSEINAKERQRYSHDPMK
jgi:hypothetical protein